MMTRRVPGVRLLLAALSMAWLPLMGVANAQSYPDKPVRLVVPYPPGGPTDIVARLYADKLTESLGKRFLVDNKPGASGRIALEHVARSPADGYTIILGTASTQAVAGSIQKNLPYDPIKDFEPISLAANAPILLAANADLPVSTIPELIAYAKKPGVQLNYGTGGAGALPHLGGELLKAMTGLSMQFVAYKGDAAAVTDTATGILHLTFAGPPNILPFVSQGKVKILGSAAKERSALLKEVPTIGETVPGYEVSSWYGIFAPAQTPAGIVALLSREFQKAAAMADVRDKFAAIGQEAVASSPQDLKALLVSDAEKWARIIKSANIQAE